MGKLKIIDLLIMTTKKRKEMPVVIEYNNQIYEWNENIRDYQGQYSFLFMDMFKNTDYDLNKEVKIAFKYPYSYKK